ncbi:neuropeptide-like 3 [Ostrinia furnacalis]|uniref:neuropeptide-like 3 n=1 Tax=Ostrinia furnacalis TaxID=93504 RepID=UPI00103A019B|nr:neuropeptide-like 3 [Ostrinia furnacalis]
MHRMVILLSLLAMAAAAPAPKPIVVYPHVSSVYHPPVVSAPLVHAPVVSHVSTLYHHPHVLPVHPLYF